MFSTHEMVVSFLAVDSTGEHPKGSAVTWKNPVTLKYRLYAGGKGEKMLELKAAPNKDGKTSIRYTTDGSDPKLGGGSYESPVSITKGTQIVLAFAERNGVQSEVLQIPIDWSKSDGEKPIDPLKPAVWKHRHEFYFTNESYEFIECLKRHEATVSSAKVSITGDRWVELTLHELIKLTSEKLREAVEAVRKLPDSGQVSIEVGVIHFSTGQRLLDWLNETKTDVKPGEVKQ